MDVKHLESFLLNLLTLTVLKLAFKLQLIFKLHLQLFLLKAFQHFKQCKSQTENKHFYRFPGGQNGDQHAFWRLNWTLRASVRLTQYTRKLIRIYSLYS